MSREERERMKQEYKEHYRQLLEQKKRLAAYERKARVMQSLREIDPSPVLESFQGALQAVRERIVQAEARLEVYLDHNASTGSENISPEQAEAAHDFTRKQNAKDILSEIRADMGTIEREMEKKAGEITSEKTVQTGLRKASEDTGESEADPARTNVNASKTIGRKKT
ncbi:MAG: hypothetical protein LAT84_09670 [Balneolia bacterium]|nr:hypothetical protein [Balneolia bacterium]